MRAVLQRVAQAAVEVDGIECGRIGRGLLVFLGVGPEDDKSDGEWLSGKIARLRLFDDASGAMNESLVGIRGEALVVSQFTLYGSTRKGNRLSFNGAAPPELARRLYQLFLGQLEQALGRPVPCGIFGAAMRVSLINDGPVTLLVDSKRRE